MIPETPTPGPMSHLDAHLVRNVLDVHGKAGEAWLNRLPAVLDDCAQRWGLSIGRPFAALSYNYVTRVARADGASAVLKVGVPDKERRCEIAATVAFEGNGMVRQYEADAALGASLLELLVPGEPLNRLTEAGDDDGATLAAAGLMRALWRPAPANGPYPTVSDWAGGLAKLRELYDGGTGPLPAYLVDAAESTFAGLAGAPPQLLLHGDFHHGNILSAQRAPWIAIDPKGLVGPPGYDAGNFLRGSLEETPDPRRALIRRIDILSAELGMHRNELRRWSLAQAVLSAWWSIEDHGEGWQDTIAMARILADLPG